MNSARARLFWCLVLCLAGSGRRVRTTVSQVPSNVRVQSLERVDDLELTGRTYWLQDESDGRCLGADGAFGQCGDAVWRVFGRPGNYQFAVDFAGVATDPTEGSSRAARGSLCLNRERCHWPTGPVGVSSLCGRCGAQRWAVDDEGRLSHGSVFSGRKCVLRVREGGSAERAHLAPCSALSTRFRVVEYLAEEAEGADADGSTEGTLSFLAARPMREEHRLMREEMLRGPWPSVRAEVSLAEGAPASWRDPDSGLELASRLTADGFLRAGRSVRGSPGNSSGTSVPGVPFLPQHQAISPLPKDETGHFLGTDDPFYDGKGGLSPNSSTGHVLMGAGPFTWFMGIRFYTVSLYVDAAGALAAAATPGSALHAVGEDLSARGLLAPAGLLPNASSAAAEKERYARRAYAAAAEQPLADAVTAKGDWMAYGRSMQITMNKWVPAGVMINAMRKEWKTIGPKNLDVLLRSAERDDMAGECCKAGTTMTFTWEPSRLEFSIRLDGYLVDVISDAEGAAFISRQMFEQYTRIDTITPLAKDRIAAGYAELLSRARAARSSAQSGPGDRAPPAPRDPPPAARAVAVLAPPGGGNVTQRSSLEGVAAWAEGAPRLPVELGLCHLLASVHPESGLGAQKGPADVDAASKKKKRRKEGPRRRPNVLRRVLMRLRGESPDGEEPDTGAPAAELLAAVAEGESSLEDLYSHRTRRAAEAGVGAGVAAGAPRIGAINPASRGLSLSGAGAGDAISVASEAFGSAIESEWEHTVKVVEYVWEDHLGDYGKVGMAGVDHVLGRFRALWGGWGEQKPACSPVRRPRGGTPPQAGAGDPDPEGGDPPCEGAAAQEPPAPEGAALVPLKLTRPWAKPARRRDGQWWNEKRRSAIEAALWRAIRSLLALLYCLLLAVLSLPSRSGSAAHAPTPRSAKGRRPKPPRPHFEGDGGASPAAGDGAAAPSTPTGAGLLRRKSASLRRERSGLLRTLRG